jgi:hypothetical protein
MNISYIATRTKLNNISNENIIINNTYIGEFITYNNIHISDIFKYDMNIIYEINYNKKECKKWTDYCGRIILNKIIIKNKYLLSEKSTFEYLNSIGAFRTFNIEVLYWACKKGYKDIVIYLLEIGYYIYDSNPLEYSIQSNNLDFVIFIYNLTAKLNIKIDTNYLLVLATYKENNDIKKYFIQLYSKII